MKTEAELDANIAKLFDEDTTPKVEMVNGKPRISDEQTLREMQFAEACEELVAAEGEFAEWDAKATQKWRTQMPTRRTCATGSTALSDGTKLTGICGCSSPGATAPCVATAFTIRSAVTCCDATPRSYEQTREQSAAVALTV